MLGAIEQKKNRKKNQQAVYERTRCFMNWFILHGQPLFLFTPMTALSGNSLAKIRRKKMLP
jgi:hypothetical protein